MPKTRTVLLCLAAAGVAISAGGCVSKSVHDRTLADLSRTRADYDLAAADVFRLKTGAGRLADNCDATAMRLRSADGSVARLRTNEKQIAECLAELQTAMSSHARSLRALEDTLKQFGSELAELQKAAADLASQPSAPGPRMGAAGL